MTLIDRIKNDPELGQWVVDKCSEHNAYVEVSRGIPPDRYVILKPDAYYNSLRIEKPPKSPDCLIIQRCGEHAERYRITIVELRDIRSPREGFTVAEIRKKFETCLHDFMSVVFRELLDRDYEGIALYFVTTTEIYKNRGSGNYSSKFEAFIDNQISYRGKKRLIKPIMPSEVIKPC